jgi:hypothetical protein
VVSIPREVRQVRRPREQDRRPEGDPDDHANGEINHVAAHGKFLEFVEHGEPPGLADFSSLEI